MTLLHRFSIPGEPKGWARTRHRGSLHFTPTEQRAHQNTVRWIAKASNVEMRDEPVEVVISAWMEPPASAPKARRAAMLSGQERPTKRPDLDNIAKTILDALNGLAWKDDSQVVSLTISKHWSDAPRVQVEIRRPVPAAAVEAA